MKPITKEKVFPYYKIKIDLLREVTKHKNGESYKDKMWLVEIDDRHSKLSFNVPINKSYKFSKKLVGKQIGEEK